MHKVLAWLVWFFDESEDPDEPVYDPLHLGATILITLTAFGLLYWLLWTLLVFEGGLFRKIIPAFSVLLTAKTLQDYGYEGPWDRGVFEGWLGNSVAFVLTIAVVAALTSLYREAAPKSSTPKARSTVPPPK